LALKDKSKIYDKLHIYPEKKSSLMWSFLVSVKNQTILYNQNCLPLFIRYPATG